ncbi:dnaJ homolog subfamily C member 17 isoform X1 [Bufo bufo]|uniref:dnaJ homolog subfamily C member 17 isoform X1 n=1 Tax=Bufo bufo TaxID=8384 RepID=UPI001ABE3A3D|nr:dnaJ homolog subfamily C member 17 isoform X1 [Bufo bufo]
MASGKMAASKELMQMDLYGLLGIDAEASEKEIKKAYRQKALTCHPDKNPDNPRAAELFHQLSQALEVLTDGAARAAYDRLRKAKVAAAKRTQKLDEKRKKVKLDLEAREKEAQVTDEEEAYVARTFEQEIIRLREEGSRQLEEQQRLVREQIRLETLQKTQGQRGKTRSCRDRFRRELVISQGHGGDGGLRKKPYLYTKQLQCLRPLLDLGPTVDSLEDQGGHATRSTDDEQAAGPLESPRPVAEEAESVEQLARPESQEESSALKGAAVVPSSPERPRRQPRRRRGTRDLLDSASNTRALIDSQVLEYLRQRRDERKVERMLSGLAPLIESLSIQKKALFVNIMSSVALIMDSPMDPMELVCTLDNLKQRALMLSTDP